MAEEAPQNKPGRRQQVCVTCDQPGHNAARCPGPRDRDRLFYCLHDGCGRAMVFKPYRHMHLLDSHKITCLPHEIDSHFEEAKMPRFDLSNTD